MTTFKQHLTESLTTPYPIKINERGKTKRSPDEITAAFTTGSGSNGKVWLAETSNGNWVVEFHVNGRQEMTGEGEGEEFRIFSTVVSAVDWLMKNRTVTGLQVMYVNRGERPAHGKSAASLYKKLLNKFASKYGFSMRVTTVGNENLFMLTKK